MVISKIKHALLALVMLLGVQNVYAEEWQYTFRPGDTLWDLCAKYIAAPDCWQKIATRNNVSEPKQIKPGTRLHLPISWLKVLPASAKVLSTRGDAKYIKAGTDQSIALDKSTEILVGDQIVTKDGAVTLQFADESILIITPGSEVTFDTLSLYGESGMVDTRVRLNRGRAKAKVKPTRGPGSRYEILTPAAVAAVRGTEFRVVSEITDPPQMRTEVLEGNVAVGNEVGEQSLPAGFAVKTVSGEKPSEPVKMLPAPVFEQGLPEEISAFPWTIAWGEVDGAKAYRVQVLKNGFFFDDLVSETEIDAAKYSVPELDEGQFKINVRAIDESGIEGLEATYNATVSSPKTVEPLTVTYNETTINGDQVIQWQWPALEGASKYLVKVTADIDGQEEQLTTIELIDNAFEQGVSEPGTYRIQVAPVFDSQVLAFSEQESVTISPEDDAPVWLKALVVAIFAFVML